jgi:eukaryotic-like serine/threonine-protein kinase
MALLPPGTKLGRFEITGVLGEGAMGVVYLAHDPQIDRPVALKMLRPEALVGEHGKEIESRFLKEAKLVGRLSHPNVVTIYEAGEDKGAAYIAMEYVEGQPLTAWLGPQRDLSLPDRISIVRQVGLALEHAHDRGVLHRDIKPGNILITPDRRVKVADFGIGKLLTPGSSELTRTGHMIGSPAYMSPEQIRGEKLDGRSDLFSLGVVFYELLTGVRPFPGDSITTLVYQILHLEPRDPVLVKPELPPATSDVFARLLAKTPEKRPASAREFLQEVDRIQSRLSRADKTAVMSRPAPEEKPVALGAPSPPPAQPVSFERRSAGPGYLFGAAALILAAAALVWIWKSTSGRQEPAAAGVSPAPASLPAQPTAAVIPTAAAATASATAPVLPTAGPAQAADAIVGAPRVVAAGGTPNSTLSSPRRTLTALARQAPTSAPRSEPPAPVASVEKTAPSREGREPADNLYRTRRYGKFGVSPDQARIYLDGRYVGIADDWDDRGGGKTLEIGREGTHRVRLELPGYRTLHLEILVTSSGDETVDIKDELKRESKVDYPKIPKVDDRTVGPVEFTKVDPPDAVVSENDRTYGPASSFGVGSPLKLNGPRVHDLTVSAPGHRSKTFRILVASNADRDVAKVKAELKRE